MSKRYTGGVVSSAVPTVNAASASGIFTLGQQATAQSNNNWPPFKVEKSLRFRASAGGAFTKVVASSSAGTKGTLSVWVKKGKDWDSNNNGDLVAAIDGYNYGQFFQYGLYFGNTTNWMNTSAVYRDPSAWYHVFFVFDTTLATSTDRLQIWVNGVRQTAGATVSYPTQNASFPFLTGAQTYYIGGRPNNSDNYFDGYMSEYNFVDGQALTPSSFGAYDKDGNWSPIAYTGTYGQNGFYLNFKDATSTTTIGYDYSGNGNHWTSSGFNVATANTSYDSMIDVPSDQSDGTANNRGNYCTLNPLDYLNTNTGSLTLTNGNLLVTRSTTAYGGFPATMALPSSGKFVFEFTANQAFNGSTNEAYFGIGVQSNGTFTNSSATGYAGDYYTCVNITGGTGQISKKISGGSITTPYAGGALATGDVFQFLVDMTNGTVDIKKNGSAYGSQVTGLPNTLGLYPYISMYGSVSMSANFGQRPFASAPTSGYATLNTYNLPEPTIKQPNKHFDATLYTGNDSGQSVTNAGIFQPSLIWYKARSAAYYNTLEDDIRGAGTRLFSNLTDGESNDGIMTSFNSNGFTLGANSGEGINKNAVTYVAWQWKGATSNTTNTTGAKTSVIRANQTAGFSIVTWTVGSSGTNTTVGHGLSAAPLMILSKARNKTYNWDIFHKSASPTGAGRLIFTTAAFDSGNNPYGSVLPTSSVFTFNEGFYANGDTVVSYCFTPIAGYSAFDSYTGNGSADGPFIYTGFRPRFVMIKGTAAGADWFIFDSSRNTYNVIGEELYAESSAAGSSGTSLDFLSNGFKLRSTSSYINSSGGTFVYAAIAEVPFKYSRSR